MQVNLNSTPETPLEVSHDHFPDSATGPFGTLTVRQLGRGYVTNELNVYFTRTDDLKGLIREAKALLVEMADADPGEADRLVAEHANDTPALVGAA